MQSKAPTRKYDKPIQIRVTPELRELFQKAAETSGLTLSGWVRDRLKRAARKDLK